MYYITSICFPSAINCSFDFFLQIDHVERVEPLESPLTSTENATPIVNEGQQLNSVSDLGREQQLASHSNEGSMPELALSQTAASEMRPMSMDMEQQSTILTPPGGTVEVSASQPQTYTNTHILPGSSECTDTGSDVNPGDNTEPSGHIEDGLRDISNLEHRHRNKRRCMLLDLESSDEEL